MNPCDIEISAGYAGDSAAHTLGMSSLSSALAVTVMALGLSMTATDQAVATDFADGRGGVMVLESAQASDSVTQARLTKATRLDSAKAADRVLHIYSDRVESSGTATDVVADYWYERVTDLAQAQAIVETRTLASGFASSAGKVRDLLLSRYADDLSDGAVAGDFTASGVRAAQFVADLAVAGDFVAGDVASASAITDLAVAGDFASGLVRGSHSVVDHAAAGDFTQDGREESVLWTCPSMALGMSRLLPGALHSLAVVDGVLCACGPEGLMALDAPADAPTVATGLTDFDSPAMKRASFAYVGYTGEPVTLSVGNTGSGTELTYSYPLPAKVAQAAVPSRASLGKGARSRYWRFTITGTTFELHDLALEIAETSRKV